MMLTKRLLLTFTSLILLCVLASPRSYANAREQAQLTQLASKLGGMLPQGSKLISNPSVNYLFNYGNGTTKTVIQDSDSYGGLRADIKASKGNHPWDSGLTSEIFEAVKKDDVLHITFFVKAISAPNDSGRLTGIGVQLRYPPYTSVFSHEARISTEWQTLSFAGRADQDYDASALQSSFQVASQDQTIAFGPVMVFNVGPVKNIDSLPFIK